MATPRSPYVCIGDSLLDEPWPPELKLILVLLSCHMHQRWRSDRRLSLDDVARYHPVSRGALLEITGTKRHATARSRVMRLPGVCSIDVTWMADTCIIRWPKWAEYNRKNSRERPVTGPVSARSEAPPKPKPKPKKEERPSGGRSPLLNLLSRQEGSEEEKRAFVAEMGEIIEAEAEEKHPTDPKARSAAVRALVLRYWRAQRKGFAPRGSSGGGKVVDLEAIEREGVEEYRREREARRNR